MTDAATGVPLAQTDDMVAMHRVFREVLDRDVALVEGCDASDRDRVELVGSWFDNVLRLLHVHHEGEDELLTPRLLARCTPQEAADVARIAAQHGDVMAAIEQAEGLLAAWRAVPSVEVAAALAAALRSLGEQLGAHLDEEERVVLPIAARHVTAPEWGEMPAHGMQHFSGDKLWLILGLIREQMTPAQLADMDAHMPPPALAFWTGTGEGLYTSYAAALRG